ncbi:16S rRNA (guanine(966)-N(2))-methyltransferase RsmD [Mycolicibacterium palauense]|uniref:16S rRNA (guanine(966)-N(2))-methyltransferase RsmD n=1 Tax=Mycolicibacterium palauense TaxID=2034511 RepID=UPI000BFEBFDD|nr:16S rRNA (guanine(966)-N(2))-methyltransferase RsmD [Mycolicibacterium palauense]
MTRIIAGAVGGRPLSVPSRGTRPTTDRVRESLFNVLAARLDFTGLTVLDLYAGSGALGLEALSRGAAAAQFVESDQRAAAVLARNIAAVDLPGATVHRAPVNAVLAHRASAPVDLVFADPPYDLPTSGLRQVIQLVTENGWAAEGTIAVIERAAESAPLSWPPGWAPWRERRYGGTRLETAEFAGP